MALVKGLDLGEKEFHQAAGEVFDFIKPLPDLHPEYRKAKISEAVGRA